MYRGDNEFTQQQSLDCTCSTHRALIMSIVSIAPAAIPASKDMRSAAPMGMAKIW